MAQAFFLSGQPSNEEVINRVMVTQGKLIELKELLDLAGLFVAADMIKEKDDEG